MRTIANCPSSGTSTPPRASVSGRRDTAAWPPDRADRGLTWPQLPRSWFSIPASAGSRSSARSPPRGPTRATSMSPTTPAFPTANMPEEALIARIVDVIGKAIAEHAPDLVVVACNTASTLALAELRARFSVPFVGTVPAIKPACAQSVVEARVVLGTQATVGREYTRALIREFAAGCDVHAGRLAAARRLCRGRACRRAGGRRRHQSRNRRLLRRSGWAPHRHGGARLHALSAAARALSRQCALAGRLARSGAGDCAPRRRPAARAPGR